jgi:predicted ArsR family transcriptional regulator
MHALTDFDPHSHARADDPATSHAAAESAALFVGKHCDRILACLRRCGALTKDEIADRTGLTPVQVDRRLPDLQERGEAEPTGDVRQSRAGRAERVWKAIAEGGEA